MAEFASKGLANGVGIPALVLGGLGFLQSGGLGNLGGIFSGGNCGNNQVNAALMAENAALKSERYTEQAQLDTRDRIAALNKDVIGYVVDLGQKAAVNQANFDCLSGKVSTLQNVVTSLADEASANRVNIKGIEKDVQCLAKTTADRFSAERAETGSAIALVSERSAAATRELKDYVDGHFLPGSLVLPKTKVCPEPMNAKNAWIPPNNCSCSNGQI